VILRLIRGVATPTQLGELQRALDARVAGPAGAPPGLRQFHLAARPAGDWFEVLVLAVWDSLEDALAADALGLSPMLIAIRTGLIDMDPAHFETDAPTLRGPSAPPVAIRIATGTFSKPGSDLEMVGLLRERMPLIGDELSEAYVGRRMLERAVEVTFVSVWRALPIDRPLEEAFWPDIALRYDRFSVDVYGPVPMSVE